MPYVLTAQFLSYRTVRGTLKRWPANVVHGINDRTWEGAHYADGSKAWAFLKAINETQALRG